MTSEISNSSSFREKIKNDSCTLNGKSDKEPTHNNINGGVPERIIYDSRDEKPSMLKKVKAFFCVWQTITLTWFTSFLFLYLLIWGSRILQVILSLVLIYQYFFAKGNEACKILLRSLAPQHYFNSFKIIAESDLKEKNCLYPFHPHGIFTVSPYITRSIIDILQNSHYCVSNVMLSIPFSGIYPKLLGCLPVDNDLFKKIMKNEENIMFIPGGFEEATITDYNRNKIFVKARTGFIKYALDFGYSIIPCFALNENKLYYTLPYFEKFRLFK